MGDTLITNSHHMFELASSMMLGLRTTVGAHESKPDVKLDQEDFKFKENISFPSKGTVSTPAHDGADFEFKDYCPEVFRKVRQRFHIDPADYILCVCGNIQYLEFLSNSKSGQFFFFSYDKRYMIKTVSQPEAKVLIDMLPGYVKHICDYPNTLITRSYGLHRVKPKGQKERHFLIMGSVFYTKRIMHLTYDLKGSTQGRSATPKEIERGLGCVYKDLDFMEGGPRIKIGEKLKNQFMQQIEADSQFLTEHRIMDYSLLVGIHDRTKLTPNQAEEEQKMEGTSFVDPSPFYKDDGGMVAADGVDEVYYLGIIDILITYGTKKKMETAFKSVKYDSNIISAVPPPRYAERFKRFVEAGTI